MEEALFPNRADWRDWLSKIMPTNSVWLFFIKNRREKDNNEEQLKKQLLVDRWQLKRVDEERFMLRFSIRKSSVVSDNSRS